MSESMCVFAEGYPEAAMTAAGRRTAFHSSIIEQKELKEQRARLAAQQAVKLAAKQAIQRAAQKAAPAAAAATPSASAARARAGSTTRTS